jgi:hypothetical protein
MIETVRLLPNASAPDWKISPSYPPFHPFIYSLENAVPLVKLGMDAMWTPDPQHVPQLRIPGVHVFGWQPYLDDYWFLVFSRWFLIVWGWVQATVLAASLADRFRK